MVTASSWGHYAVICFTVLCFNMASALPMQEDLNPYLSQANTTAVLDELLPQDDIHVASSLPTSPRVKRGARTGSSSKCNPDPRSTDVTRRALCPFEYVRDHNELRIPDVLLRARCSCENSPCSSTGHNKCMTVLSPIKVAYLDAEKRSVVSTETVHIPVACVCAASSPGRNMPDFRTIVV